MATSNPYYISINFPETLYCGNLVKVTLQLTGNTTGTSQTVNANDVGVKLIDIGKPSWEFDIEDFLITAGTLSCSILDKNGFLEPYLFGDLYDHIDKRAKYTMEIKYEGEADYTTEFDGYFLDQAINYDSKTKLLKAKVAPKTDLLNKKMLYDLNGNFVGGDILGFTANSRYQLIKVVLLNAYKVVNPGLVQSDLTLTHDWKFAGRYASTGTWDMNITIDKIWFNFNDYFQSIIADKSITNVGDLLKKMATDFGCYTGMLTSGRPFFKKFFAADQASIEVLESDIESHEKSYALTPIDFVKFTIKWNFVDGSPQIVIDDTAGTFTQLEGKYIDRTAIPVAMRYRNGNFISNLLGDQNGVAMWDIMAVKDPAVTWTAENNPYYVFDDPNYSSLSAICAYMWYRYRSSRKACRNDIFSLIGIKWQYLQTFTARGVTYRARKMVKDIVNNKTSIEAIPVNY